MRSLIHTKGVVYTKVTFNVKEQHLILEPLSIEDEKTLRSFEEFSDKRKKKRIIFILISLPLK